MSIHKTSIVFPIHQVRVPHQADPAPTGLGLAETVRPFIRTKAPMRLGLLFSILGLAPLLGGCPNKNNEEAIIAEPKRIAVPPQKVGASLEFDFMKQGDQLIIQAITVPEGLEELTCTVAGVAYPSCLDGIAISGLRPGEHQLTAVYRVNGRALVKSYFFSIQKDGYVAPPSEDSPQESFFIHPMGVTLDFKNNSPVKISDGLKFEFGYAMPANCEPRLMCKRPGGEKVACAAAPDAQSFRLLPHEIAVGLQSITVQGICANAPEDTLSRSNTLTFSFYGVQDDYETLALRKFEAGRFSLFTPERLIDCFGKITYECQVDSISPYETCPNLQELVEQIISL
jgi:hypothetical protein